jgi:hypothetical protein
MTMRDYDLWEWNLTDQIRVAGPTAPWHADIALSPQPAGYYMRITAYPEAQPTAAVALLNGPYPAGPPAMAVAQLLAAAVIAYWRPVR